MVREQTLKEISRELSRLCVEHGLPSNLEVKNLFDNECDVLIPKAVANSMPDGVDAVRDGLSRLSCVCEIYDRGAGRQIQGDDFRQFEITVADGHWTHTDEDDKIADEEMEKQFSRHSHEDSKRREMNSDDYLIPLPPPDGSKNTEIYLTMCYEPYDWIEKGEKVEEFRSYNEYYSKKFLSHPIKTVRFQRGYGGPGRPKPKQMRFEIKGIKLWDPEHKMECDPLHPIKGIVPQFFVIQLGKRLET